MRISLFTLVYLAIGLVVALTNGYNSVAGVSERPRPGARPEPAKGGEDGVLLLHVPPIAT